MSKELELFGLYLSNHPVTKLKSKYSNIVSLNEIELYFDKNIDIIVYIDKVKEITTKKGDKMAFLVASDEIASIDITLFPKVYKTCLKINNGDIAYIKGHVEKRYDKYQIICSQVRIL